MLPIRDHEPSHRFPFITIGIIALNVFVFFQELAAENLDAFIRQWALIPALVDAGDLFSFMPFVTSQFLHAGIAHILFNMWYLWIFGDNVEGHFGHGRFLGFYLISGVLAALTQFFFLIGSDVPMLGASGAVAGVLGAYWALFPHHRVDTLIPYFGFLSRATLPAGAVLLFWFVSQLFSGVASVVGGSAATAGVAWWAHIGGFVFGWLMGRVARWHRPAPQAPRAFDPEHIDLWK